MVDTNILPNGLFFFEDAVPESFCNLIEEWFQTTDVKHSMFSVTNSQGKSSCNSRKVIHYGYKYDYSSGGTKQKAANFPHIIDILLGIIPEVWRCYSAKLNSSPLPEDITSKLNQCIINRYLPGQGIGHHIDRSEYGDVIICFTFLSGREMEFTRCGFTPYKVYTPRRSMYVMTGESRYKWGHQMRPRKSDKKDGIIIPREECFSITFREVNSTF